MSMTCVQWKEIAVPWFWPEVSFQCTHVIDIYTPEKRMCQHCMYLLAARRVRSILGVDFWTLDWSYRGRVRSRTAAARQSTAVGLEARDSIGAPYDPQCPTSAQRTRGARIVQWLERPARDQKVAGSSPGRSGGRTFFSRVNFLLFRYPSHPGVTAVAGERSRSFCQRCRWQVPATRACTLCMWLCMKSRDMVHGCMGSSFMRHQPCNNNQTAL